MGKVQLSCIVWQVLERIPTAMTIMDIYGNLNLNKNNKTAKPYFKTRLDFKKLENSLLDGEF